MPFKCLLQIFTARAQNRTAPRAAAPNWCRESKQALLQVGDGGSSAQLYPQPQIYPHPCPSPGSIPIPSPSLSQTQLCPSPIPSSVPVPDLSLSHLHPCPNPRSIPVPSPGSCFLSEHREPALTLLLPAGPWMAAQHIEVIDSSWLSHNLNQLDHLIFPTAKESCRS